MFGIGKKSTEKVVTEVVKSTESNTLLRRNQSTLKDIIAPGGIDASYTNHLAIMSSKTRLARSMVVSTLPRMCTFPEFLRGMYTFGDINVSVFIRPLNESTSQTDLNRTINELESERIVAQDRGDINRERVILQKRMEAEELRDTIASRIK